jgi:hypothetical protein
MFFLLVYHLIGIQPFCTLNINTYEIQCNYETHADCVAYRERDEMCIPHPVNFK